MLRAAAREVLWASYAGGPRLAAALEGAAALCRAAPAGDAGDEERRELLGALVGELRGATRPDPLWTGLVRHLAAGSVARAGGILAA